MSAPAWTPGPWVQFICDGLLSVLPAGRPGEIAQVWIEDGLPNAEANARLIAAAPDMAGVCAELRRLSLVIESAVRYADPHHDEAIWALIRANDAALARARGEPQPAASAAPSARTGGGK